MREAELKSLSDNLALLPVATGMTMSLTLRAIAQEQSKQAGQSGQVSIGNKSLHTTSVRKAERTLTCASDALSLVLQYSEPSIVIISRIDQKTCLKAISAAGFKPEVVELVREESDSGLTTDIQQIKERIEAIKDVRRIVAIVSTTSCFAPRLPDDVEVHCCHSACRTTQLPFLLTSSIRVCRRNRQAIGKLALERGIPHVINNAYGVQCKTLCRSIERAARTGRVDAVIQVSG